MNLHDLQAAIADCNLERVNEYIRGGGNVNLVLPYRKTPLVYAITVPESEKGNTDDIILRLIDNGANVNARDRDFQRTATMWAIMNRKSDEIVLRLINAGTDLNLVDRCGSTTLKSALMYNYGKNVIKTIIDNGADVNIPLDEDTSSTLNCALQSADPEIIEMVLQAGVRIHTTISLGENIFQAYCRDRCKVTDNCKFKRVTDILVSKGIDIKMEDDYSNTVIHLVTCNYIICLAQKAGVSVDAANVYEWTPLILSVKKAREHKVDDLLFIGADPNWKNSLGETILHSDLPTINQFGNLLIYHGANLNAVNNFGETPLSKRFRKMVDYTNEHERGLEEVQHLRGYLQRMETIILNYLLYEDATSLLDIVAGLGIYRDVLNELNHYIYLCRAELNGMQNSLLTEDLSIHQFCRRKRYYSSKFISIEQDQYLISSAAIMDNFPIYKDIILMRIYDNKRKCFKKHMLDNLEKFGVKPADGREIQLTNDAMYHIGNRFLNRRYLYDFLTAFFVH